MLTPEQQKIVEKKVESTIDLLTETLEGGLGIEDEPTDATQEDKEEVQDESTKEDKDDSGLPTTDSNSTQTLNET